METPVDTDTLIQYALGTLEPNETAQVAAAVAQSEVLALELAKWQSYLAIIGQSVEQTEPSPMLEQKILTAIRKKVRAAPRPMSQRQTTSRMFRSFFTRAIPIAALSLAVFFGWRNTQLENQIVVLQQQAKTRVSVLSNSQLVKLASSTNIPIGQAYLTPSGQLMIALKLPEPSVGKTYQAWFIAKNNTKPQPLETLQNNLDTKVPSNTVVIAISLEPIGGSTTPSEVLGVGEVKF
jgi:anti-sigma-K factor RskA